MNSTAEVGDICTTYEYITGLVRITKIEPYWVRYTLISENQLTPDGKTASDELVAYVDYLEDHPRGYKQGQSGWYLLKNLKKTTVEETIRQLEIEIGRWEQDIRDRNRWIKSNKSSIASYQELQRGLA